MATKPTLNLPQWASSEPIGSNVIEPTSRKTTGYTKNLQGIPEKPTYQELNFLLKSNYEWTQYYENYTDELNEFTITAGENLTANDCVRISGGQLFKADNTTPAGVASVVGQVKDTTSTGQVATVAFRYYDGNTGLTVGAKYYVGVSGAITATKPSIAFELGIAVSSTRINFTLNQDFENTSIVDASPQFSLIDTGSGSGQTQKVSYQTADGEFAIAQGETTGAGQGRYNIYTDNGSGLGSRISIGYESGGLFNIMNGSRIHRINTGSFGNPSKMMIIDNRSSTGTSHFHGLLIVSQSSTHSNLANAGIWQIDCDSVSPSTTVTNIGPTSSGFQVAVDANRIYVWASAGGTFNFECTMIVNGFAFDGLITTPSLI